MDSANHFGVRRTKAGVQLSGYNGEPLSDEEVLNLAAWLLKRVSEDYVRMLATGASKNGWNDVTQMLWRIGGRSGLI